MVYRELVTPDDQAWPMQLYSNLDNEPLRSFVYSCEPLPTLETVYRLGLASEFAARRPSLAAGGRRDALGRDLVVWG